MPLDRESVYAALPKTLQNLAVSSLGAEIEMRRLDSRFRELLTQYERRSLWPRDQVIAYRDQKLSAFVRTAAEEVPYYGRLFAELGIDPLEIRSLADLSALPLLHKRQLQDSSSDFTSRKLRRGAVSVHTSGTTGAGFQFMTSPDAVKEQWAVWWRYRRWHGIQRRTWCANFTGRTIVPLAQTDPPYWRYNVPGRQIMFSGYHLGPATADAYLRELRKRRPPWLHGYPSVIALLAAHVLESGVDIGYPIRWVTIGAENLLEQQKQLITNAFGVSPLQHYGMAEAAANVSECERGRLHVDEDFAAVEFVRDEATGQSWIVGTNMTNPYTPMIRYVIGDLGAPLDDQRCCCGRAGRLVGALDGRNEDYVVLSNGARLGRMDHIFKDMVNIREAQIYQSVPGEFTLRVVRGPWYRNADEDALLLETRRRVGADTRVSVEYRQSLPRTANGKLRLVISEIDRRGGGVLQTGVPAQRRC